MDIFNYFKMIQTKSLDNNSRRAIAARLIIFFAYTIASVFTLFNYLQGNMQLFYTNAALLCAIALATLLWLKKSIYWIANILLIIMSIGIVWGTYVNKGQDNVFYWGFLSVTFMMVSFGHKKGLIVASLFYALLYLIMYQFIGETISFSGYIRFVVVSIMIILASYFYEYSITTTIEKLHKANEQLSLLTKTDSLTGLYNRRYFDEVLEEKFKIAKRTGRLFVFAMIDIDFFKLFNDTYGHHSGDEVLKMVATSIQSSLKRVDDYAFRLGGEEFGICFSVEHKEDAFLLLNNLRESIENLKIFNINNEETPYITVSIGYHIVKAHNTYDRDDIYKASDNALYDAKHKGRNRVEISDLSKV